MTEATTLQQHLEKAYMLFGKAQKLIAADRAARRILHEINELISAMEEFQLYGLDYDEAEVGTKLRYYEKQLQLIEEKRDSMLLRSFRQMVSKSDDKLGSLPHNLDEEKYFINWMKEKGYEECYYSKVEALRRLDEIGAEAEVREEEDPLGINDLWCLKVRKNE
ncbi:hypothetical protein SULI_08030 [Saccharolobus solfataricus]|uniref:Uncharacterized protein n=2 Tax=Saccharolobus solfataricus TaxID=2287 RepID=A0A0E3KBS6_SACSO|nr:hypothetical protein [Saccharolobus solfataricus]AKA73864.1 hypothetical protein SULB_1606 [Saccharolobus solfataricus]AKA76562.1 hypothetical protein SULC_1604 [Saccharolobus solfataricus]AKA79255.1 hypothetical protein SULA_1605 [Saccharolobus solfataricus]AZF68344.1 hypothetical protein SULG_08030 [Saccharolobus solfataricus]AZF70964.1 hypothetical protein SULH_08030 [Saccharolobus solfataricus]